ncbi:hypothetical protein Salat_2107900 [Sesamum alatum]|uniref:Uncharacterized protein n=1 Tax=Sesamum alatum TaxID=300844 RepID=A0AAE1Y1Y7_9LAMI|nr:hypothetical protein Salat_2107900 [Sesamum alatum]
MLTPLAGSKRFINVGIIPRNFLDDDYEASHQYHIKVIRMSSLFRSTTTSSYSSVKERAEPNSKKDPTIANKRTKKKANKHNIDQSKKSKQQCEYTMEQLNKTK